MEFQVCKNVCDFLSDVCKNCKPVELYIYLRQNDMGYVFDDREGIIDGMDEDQAERFAEVENKVSKKVDDFIDSIGGHYGFSYSFAKQLIELCFEDIEKEVESSESTEADFEEIMNNL